MVMKMEEVVVLEPRVVVEKGFKDLGILARDERVSET